MNAPLPVPRFRWFHGLLIFGICAGHVACVHHFMPLSWLGSELPIHGVDYDTHAEQTFRVIEGLEGWGKSWVYDVQLQAGFPNGTIFDADNKLWELWTYVLYRAGASKAFGFNSFVFLGHFAILPISFVVARLFGLGLGASILAMGLSSSLWLFDSYAHWLWWIGTLAYIFAAYFYLLPLALFYRFTLDRKLWRIPWIALLMLFGHLLHPYSFFVMVVPMLSLWWPIVRSSSRREIAAVVSIAVVVIAGNGYWLEVAIEHWHYVLNSAFYGQSRPGFIVADFFNVLIDAHTTGYIGTRTGFRWLCFAGAAVALFFFRRERDPRYRLFAISLAYMLAFAYVLPVIVPAAGQIQPYRFVASAMFLAVFPAAEAIARVSGQLRELSAIARAALLVLAIPALQHLASDVMYFVPGALPRVPKLAQAPFRITAAGYRPQFEYRHRHPAAFPTALPAWVDEHRDEGRIAVPDWPGERMAWRTRAQILGGFVELNMSHARAHLARWVDGKRPNERELRAYLETYAVAFIVTPFDDFGLDAHPELVEHITTIDRAKIYRSKLPVSFFFENEGRVAASTNRIQVDGTDPARDVVLKYHWHEALRCQPSCKLVREPHPRDEVGFIRVPAPHPASFTIVNSYEM